MSTRNYIIPKTTSERRSGGRDEKIKRQRNQLKSQPAEIVEKIKKFIHTGEYDDFGNEYLMSGSSVLEFLDEFLKEYQK